MTTSSMNANCCSKYKIYVSVSFPCFCGGNRYFFNGVKMIKSTSTPTTMITIEYKVLFVHMLMIID